MATILAVDDEIGIRTFLADVLADAGHTVFSAGSAAEALALLRQRPFDLLFLDLRMPGERGGMDVVRAVRAELPRLQVIVLTAHGTVHDAVEAMRLGVFDFLEKPLESPAALRALADRALNWRGARVRQAPEPVVHEAALPAPSWWSRLLWQLKQRHVYNVAVAYAAAAFVALQVAEAVVPALHLPDWTHSAVVVLIITGFPVALVLGWIYDISDAGIRRTNAALLAKLPRT